MVQASGERQPSAKACAGNGGSVTTNVSGIAANVAKLPELQRQR
jgi:hypothetical protein